MMRRYLNTLEDEKTPRSIEEYLGAFIESFKLILQQNPVERMGQAVLLAAKTALRIKAARPALREHDIAIRLQNVARNIRLMTILNDLTPEEKRILKLNPPKSEMDLLDLSALTEAAPKRPAAVKSKTSSQAVAHRRA